MPSNKGLLYSHSRKRRGLNLKLYWQRKRAGLEDMSTSPLGSATDNNETNTSIEPQVCSGNVTGSEVSDVRSVQVKSDEVSLSRDQFAGADTHSEKDSSLYEELSPLLEEKAASTDVQNDEASFMLSGRRIVNIRHLISSIIGIGVHVPFGCAIADMYPVSETRKGFTSTITLKCRMCGLTRKIETDNYSRDTNMCNLNSRVVSGMVLTGGGHSQLREICAAIDMPCIGNDTWAKYHNVVANTFHSAAWKLMSEAATEEARIACEKGEVDEDGFLCITVVADGSWAKRSYRTKYNSLSGVAVIVGYETTKILFIGVRNKYCSFCERFSRGSESKGVREHKYFKNWSGPSTGMESDAIVEGFLLSVDMHGIKYTKLIGDGDSSVHRKLIAALPYGSSQLVVQPPGIPATYNTLKTFEWATLSNRVICDASDALVVFLIIEQPIFGVADDGKCYPVNLPAWYMTAFTTTLGYRQRFIGKCCGCQESSKFSDLQESVFCGVNSIR